MFGILAFGFLSDNVLRRKMYTTLTFVTLLQIIYTLISFIFEQEIAQGQTVQQFIAILVGCLLGAN
jgi:hypothetical protein